MPDRRARWRPQAQGPEARRVGYGDWSFIFPVRLRYCPAYCTMVVPQYNRIVTRTRRILALDLGKKRIGLALSDELGLTAQGLKTLEREGRRDDIETLRKLAVESRVELFLIGDPIHMSGAPSRQGEYAREFARELEYKTGLPVKFWDERWTSR